MSPTHQRVSICEAIVGLSELWSESLGDPRISVAVLDGPVDVKHPCFAGARLAEVETLVSGSAGEDSASAHGIHVTSVIFGQHGSLVSGVAPGCRGLILPIYSAAGNESLACSQLDLARAINQAVTQGAHVINISGGELTPGGEADPLLAEAIRRCSESGLLIVAAAGNNGCPCLHIPASVPSVLAVGGMNARGSPMDFSNWGEIYRKQGVLALGESILGASPGGGVTYRSGTSFATPVVSGIAALLLSLQVKYGEKPDPQRVRTAILETADPCDPKAFADCARLLVGRLNVSEAQARVRGMKTDKAVTRGFISPASEQTNVKIWLSASEAPSACPGPSVNMHSGVTDAAAQLLPPFASHKLQVPKANHQRKSKTDKHMSDEQQTILDNSPGASDSGTGQAEATSQGVLPSREVKTIAQPDSPGWDRVPASVVPSDIEAAQPPPLVYVLGQVGYDFGTEARRDSLLQQTDKNVLDPAEILNYLQQDPASATSVIWTLSLDATVVYAIQPFGPYASVAYDRLREFLKGQLSEGVERVSIPGYIRGTAKLLNGQQVPVIFPELRGMYSWSTPELVRAVHGDTQDAAKAQDIQNFLERVYYEIRNLGVTPQERSINYAATNAFQIDFVYSDSIKAELKLDSIAVERSPICRPGSDCWDVKLSFFNPLKRLENARRVYRFTVDVSDVIPVTVGKVRHWDIY